MDQIKHAAGILSSRALAPDIAFVSPTPRTMQSLSILLSDKKFSHLPQATMDDLRERHMGAWEGMPFEDIRPALLKGEIGSGGESIDSFHTRIFSALQSIINSGYKLPLIISHGLVWQALHDLHEMPAPWIENGDLFMVTIETSRLTSQKII